MLPGSMHSAKKQGKERYDEYTCSQGNDRTLCEFLAFGPQFPRPSLPAQQVLVAANRRQALPQEKAGFIIQSHFAGELSGQPLGGLARPGSQN